MSDQWGNREQPSSQPPEPTQPNEQDPGQAWLALGVSAFTAVVLLCLLDETIDHDFSRGFYSIGTGMFVVGLVGWVQARGRRHVESHSQMILDRLAELTGQVEELQESRAAGDPAAGEAWWSGYATALEDQEAGAPRTVLPFRLPRGDRSSDSGHRLNGSELP